MQPPREFLEHLLQRRDLSENEAQELLAHLASAQMAPALAGALLAALRSKGVVADEVRGFARAMRGLARRPQIAAGIRAVDVVGTGGDASGSLNISTGTALLTAAFVDQTNVQVYYGQSLTKFVSPITVQILGWTGDQEPAELGPMYRREETFQIHCEIVSWAGDQEYGDRETEVMGAFGTLSVLIANNWTLPSTAGGSDGAVRFAECSTFTFTPIAPALTDDG